MLFVLDTVAFVVQGRGPKKHMKRLNAPKHWLLGKMEGIWAPKVRNRPAPLS